MTRCVAFLRAINVGGHVVPMDRLRRLFTAEGFQGVETFIASGNVVFDAPRVTRALEARIAQALEAALGYDVATFVRTGAEVAAVARHGAFPPRVVAAARSVNVGFVPAPLTAAARRKVLALKTPVDEFHIHGREIYWLCRAGQAESQVTAPQLRHAVGAPYTFRNINTVRRLVQKFDFS